MDVKDVNNNIGQLLFNKGNVNGPTQQVLGAGFANLLAGQATMALDIVANRSSSDKAQVDVSMPKKTVVADDKKPAPERDKNVAPKDKAPVAEKAVVDDASSPASVSVAEKPVQQENVAPVDNQAEKTVAPAEGAAEADVAVDSVETVVDVQPVEGGESVWKEMTIRPVLSGEQAVVAAVSGDEVFMMPEMPDLQFLASQPSVAVLDSATGEVKTMSGAELLNKIKTASVNGDLFSYGQTQGNMIEVVPSVITEMPKAEMVQDVETVMVETGLPKEAVAQVKGAENIVKTVEEFPAEQAFVAKEAVEVEDGDVVVNADNRRNEYDAEKFAYADERLAKQAAFLDEKISAEHKVKVDVKVNEAKIAAAATTTDLLQDDFALRDIWVSADDGVVKAENPAVQGNSNPTAATAQNNTVLNADYLAAALPDVAAGIKVVETVSASISNSAMAAETVSAPMSHAVAGGSSEFVNQARAENAKTTETSFRDVLKGMEREVVDQVKVNITKSAVKGIDKINIQLKPEDLGHIEIKMQISKDGKLQAHIISSRPETMEVLQKEIQSLEQAFNDAGFEMEDGSLSFSFREGNEAGQDSNSELRSFLGNMFEADEVVETAGNDNLESWNPAQGLNIRV